jgi:two-component system response regulator NreC
VGKIRVLIADDHAILRAGLRMLIGAQIDMEVVGEAETAAQAVQLALEACPDVVLMDISMPEGGGIKAIEEIRRSRAEIRILALTMHDDVAYLRSVLAAGGAGYVIKSAADAELLSAIRTVHRGRSYVNLSLNDAKLEEVLYEASAVRARKGEVKLSRREYEVLVLVALGYTNRQVGERLEVSIKTVETYRARLGEKLGLRSRADLVRYALEIGVLDRERPVSEILEDYPSSE